MGLANAQGGSFCATYELDHGNRCHVKGCANEWAGDTQACLQHQADWRWYLAHHDWQQLSGFWQMVCRPGEKLPWKPIGNTNVQPHDEEAAEVKRMNYFTPRQFYCVETICAPCGVIVAWAKFANAESPTNILQFLEAVYPTEKSQPDYICIDKGYMLLHSAIANGSWNMWKKTCT